MLEALDFPPPREEEMMRLKEVIERHPTIVSMVRLGTRVTGRRIMRGNRVEPLCNGDEAFPEMVAAIEAAEESVTLLSYIFDSDRAGDRFLEALQQAVGRGVEVRVLIDHVGARYSKPSMVKRLRAAGIRVETFLKPGGIVRFRYLNLRNHRKIMVVDGRVGFTGGTNIREGHCLELAPAFPAQCLHFKFEGPVVAHLQEAFAIDWAFTTGERLTGQPWFRQLAFRGDVAARGISDGPDEDLDKMAEIILGALAAAARHVRIVTPYFLPSDVIHYALVTAAMRGIELDIVLPAKNNIAIVDWASAAQMPLLLQKGCRIYRTPGPFDHTKLMTVDGLWSLVGSTNWDARSLRLNFEYNVECYDEAFTERLERFIDDKIAKARPVRLEEIAGRSLPLRLRDGLARLLSPYL